MDMEAAKEIIYALSDLAVRPMADVSRLIHYIAAEYPGVFMPAYKKAVIGTYSWEEDAIAFIKAHPSEKIQCIKKVKELSSTMELREAKEWVEEKFKELGL